MIRTFRENIIFQRDWTGRGERGFRDQMLMPAIFFGAISPGLFLSSLITGYIPGLWLAIIMNIFGYGVTHLLYLGKMERFWRGLLNIRHSWISRGMFFNILFTLFSTLYVCMVTFAGSLVDTGTGYIVRIAGVVSAVLFLAYPGFMLSFVKAIPFWRSMVEPVLFFLQGIMGGIAVQFIMDILYPLRGDLSLILLKTDYLLLVSITVIILFALIVKSLHGSAERVSVEFLMKGQGAQFFLGGAVIGGLILPLIILSILVLYTEGSERLNLLLYPVMALELMGIYLAKYGFIIAGTYTPTLPEVRIE
ncbi:MAG: hypothetical protein D6726_04160 [Nitrospirae bacterium]|nr:MAG: hypothetical protein D6726_04160 [Nitrospirota bacterium]